jgi:hypothetical protein
LIAEAVLVAGSREAIGLTAGGTWRTAEFGGWEGL